MIITNLLFNSVSYVPNKPGKAVVDVKYGDEPVPDSPQIVPVKPDIDTSRVKTTGPGVEAEGNLLLKKYFFGYWFTLYHSKKL